MLLGIGWLISMDAMFAQTTAWQQEVNHEIEVSLDDERHMLHGGIRTEYRNNSSDTLDFLWIHVWPNAYANGQTALAKQQLRQGNSILFWAMQRDLGGVDSLAFQVENQPAAWSFHPEHLDIVRLELPDPLLPGERLVYSTPFRVKLPSGRISRLGHIGKSYQITQWYPKPAVYDDSGWHEMPYLNQGEFYSEYGSFDVTLHLPASYTVGATGDFVAGAVDNAAEAQRLDAIDAWTRRQLKQDDPEVILDEFPGKAQDGAWKTLRYHQTDVHDFAWFADASWWVLKDSVILERSGRQVTTWAMFTPEAWPLWQEASTYLGDATRVYSRWIGDYPYQQVTAVDGTISAGGGMEYPNVTVIGSSSSDLELETVIVHEVGHNWFYGILGSNERASAWMDEGINSYYETRYFEWKYGDSLGLVGFSQAPIVSKLDLQDLPYSKRDQLAYLLTTQMGIDQPMECHSDDYVGLNYGTVVYNKSAAAFQWLASFLGIPRFDEGMQFYFDQWKFRHPQPDDLHEAMAISSGAELNWFFDDLVPTTAQYDVSLKQARIVEKEGDKSLHVKLKSLGGLSAPVDIGLRTASDSTWTRLGWTLPWNAEGGSQTLHIPLKGQDATTEWDWIRLDPTESTLEVNRTNDTRRLHGVARQVEPLRFRFLTRIEDSDFTQVFWSPVVGANARDGWMLGMAFHNSTLPLRNREWLFMPMYGFQSKNVTGVARWGFRLHPSWHLNIETSRFGSKATEGLFHINYRNEFRLRGRLNENPTSAWSSHLNFSLLDLRRIVDGNDDDTAPLIPIADDQRQAASLQWDIRQRQGIQTQRIQLGVRVAGGLASLNPSASFAKPTSLLASFERTQHQFTWTHQYRKVFNQDEDTWGLRAFLGYSGTSDGQPAQNLLPLSGTGIGASHDYLMDGFFTHREESFASAANEGWLGNLQGGVYGTRVTTASPMVRTGFMASARLDCALSVFGLSAYVGGVWRQVDLGDSVLKDGHWAMGLLWPAADGDVEIGIPLWVMEAGQRRENPWQAISVVLNLRNLSPFRAARQVLQN